MAGDTEYRQLWFESFWPELARSGATAAPDYIQPVLIAIGAAKGWVENVREYWHGMSALSMYAESLALVRRENSHNARLPLLSIFGALLFELVEVLRPEKREFLTLIACK